MIKEYIRENENKPFIVVGDNNKIEIQLAISDNDAKEAFRSLWERKYENRFPYLTPRYAGGTIFKCKDRYFNITACSYDKAYILDFIMDIQQLTKSLYEDEVESDKLTTNEITW